MKFPPIRVVLLIVALVIFACVPFPAERRAMADEAGRMGDASTLLVKLPRDQVRALVAWTHARGGRVVDTETMTRLIPVETSAPTVRQAVPRTTLPILASARVVWEALNASAGEARATGGGAHSLMLRDVSISPRRVRLGVVAGSAEAVEALHVALRSNATLVGRIAGGTSGIRQGTIRRERDGSFFVGFDLRLASPYVGEAPLPPRTGEIGPSFVQQAAAKSGMQVRYASALRMDRHPKEGTVLQYRDYQFGDIDLVHLLALIKTLEQADMTVTEINFTQSVPGSKSTPSLSPRALQKPKLRVAFMGRDLPK